MALLGDAAHTAHFSVGSGTKMAMEDAIALVAALDSRAAGPRPSGDTVDAALAEYEAARQPQVTRIQDAARPSLSWWEHFGRSYRQPAAVAVRLPFLQPFAAGVQNSPARRAVRRVGPRGMAGGPRRDGRGAVADPRRHRGRCRSRTAWSRSRTARPGWPPARCRCCSGPPAQRGRWGVWISAPATEKCIDQAEEAVARGLAAGASLVAVGDGTPLTRRLVCEAARLGHGRGDHAGRRRARGDAEDAARTAVLSGRADLVGVPARPGKRREARMITPIADGTVPWPEALAREYTKAGWWRGQALGAEIAAVADARKAATALVDGATRISYASLAARADALASRLTDGLGLERGDRIVVQLPNCWQFVVLTLGCLRAGIVPVMALPAHREHELAYLCEHSEARALAVPDVLRDFDHQDMAERLRAGSATLRHILVAGQDVHEGNADLTALCAEPDPSPPKPPLAGRARWDADQPDARDVAVFLLSGGTTGLPKLIARTHNDYSYNARASARAVRPRREARSTWPPCLPRTTSRSPAPASSAPCCPAAAWSCSPRRSRRAYSPPSRPEGVTITAAVPAVAQRWLAHAEEHGSNATAHAAGPAGGRRPARRRTGPAGAAGPRRDAPAGLRHGRRAAELHPARRSRRGDLRHARPAAEPGRRGADRGRRRERPARRRARRAADPRAVHAARLLPGAGAERARLHPGRLVRQRRRGAPPARTATSWSRAGTRT